MPVETQRSSDVQVLSFEVLRRFTLEHLLTRFLYATAFQELASQYTWYRKEEKEKKKTKTTFDSILDQSGIKQTSQKIFREIAKNSSLLCIYVCIYLLGVHVCVSYCSIHRSHVGTLFIFSSFWRCTLGWKTQRICARLLRLRLCRCAGSAKLCRPYPFTLPCYMRN